MKFVFLVLFCVNAFAQVSFDRIANADKEPGNWLTYSRNYQGHRFSPLNEINAGNVGRMKVKWAYQFPDPGNEVSPIVVDNIMYMTGPNSATARSGVRRCRRGLRMAAHSEALQVEIKRRW